METKLKAAKIKPHVNATSSILKFGLEHETCCRSYTSTTCLYMGQRLYGSVILSQVQDIKITNVPVLSTDPSTSTAEIVFMLAK